MPTRANEPPPLPQRLADGGQHPGAKIGANAAAFHQYLPRFTTLGGAHSTPAGAILEYEANNTAVARPVSVGYTQFETIINKAFGDIRNGSDAASRLGQASGELTRVLAQDK
jgi:hypothetical protein